MSSAEEADKTKAKIADGLDMALHLQMSTSGWFVSEDDRLIYLFGLVKERTDYINYLKQQIETLSTEWRRSIQKKP